MKKAVSTYFAIVMLFASALCISACGGSNKPTEESPSFSAAVVEIEKYGHAVLDMTVQDFAAKGFALGDMVQVSFDSFSSEMPYFDGYYVNPGEYMLRGSSPEENIAVCINYGDFSKETGLQTGDTIQINLSEKGAMLALQEVCALQYSNDRADYADDMTFANFREVTVGRITEGKLYRTASPVNNKYGRAPYADRLIKEAAVATVLNLADAEENIQEYMEEEGFDSPYYRDLYEAGAVRAMDLSSNFFTREFAVSVAEGLTFLAQKDPPYCIHCNEGKDRTGFTAMVLEALIGADLEEIQEDYMLSFYHYYGITKQQEPERYRTVLEKNLLPMLCYVTGSKDISELARMDLEAAVEQYLLEAGMEEEDIAALKEKLS